MKKPKVKNAETLVAVHTHTHTHTGSFSKIKKEKGITLLALIVTIIVLIILAGISLSMISGNDGILSRTGNAKTQTSIAQVEEIANLIYLELLEDLDNPTLADVKKGLEEKGYVINQYTTNISSITDIKLSKTSVTLEVGESETIGVTYVGSDEMFSYYVEINGNNYKMILENDTVKINKEKTKVDTNDTLRVTSSNSDVETTLDGTNINVKVKENKQATATITASLGDISKTATVAIIVRPKDGDTQVANLTFSTNYGKIDVIWLDTDNNVISEPNAPILDDGSNKMTPVVYDETAQNFVTATSTSKGVWYDYNGEEDGESVVQGNKWANATTANGSYFVWIPRYAYRITYYDSETSTTPTGFYDGFGQWKASTGEIRLELDSGIETVQYGKEKYIVHPAFETNLDNGGWDKDIKGFWCAKYEASQSDESTLQFVPNVSSWYGEIIGTQYAIAINATYGYTVSNTNSDGIRSFMYSHMMKNSEWGAVAYLTHSKYGINGKEIAINNSSNPIKTGSSGGSAKASNADSVYEYNTIQGVKASTTRNIYGIYDMSGGACERVALFNSKDDSGYFSKYGWSTIGNITGINGTVDSTTKLTTATSTKYATKYDNKTTSYYGNKIIYTAGKIGDATKEVNTGGLQSLISAIEHYNWFSDYSVFTRKDCSFAARGDKYYSGSKAGVFSIYYNMGDSGFDMASSFHTVLVP